jgi:hypothetical protein
MALAFNSGGGSPTLQDGETFARLRRKALVG